MSNPKAKINTMNTNEEIKKLGEILSATDQWDTGRLRAIASSVNDLASKAMDNTLRSAANRLETIRETHPSLDLDTDIKRLCHAAITLPTE